MRVTAAEVRKRLSQHLQLPEHAMKRLWVCSAVVACPGGRGDADGRTRGAGDQDQSGHFRLWELNSTAGRCLRASLLPSVTRAKIDARAKGDASCRSLVQPARRSLCDGSRRPLDIRQGATAVIIAPENSSAPRYLYTNRAAHVSEDIFDPPRMAIRSRIGRGTPRWSTQSASTDSMESPPSPVAGTARRNRGWSSDTAC